MTPNGNVLSVQLVNVKSVNGGKGFSQQTKSSGVDSLDALPGNGLHSGLSPDGSGSAPHTLTHANGFQKVKEYNVISPPPFLPHWKLIYHIISSRHQVIGQRVNALTRFGG